MERGKHENQHGFGQGGSTENKINRVLEFVLNTEEKYVISLFADISGVSDDSGISDDHGLCIRAIGTTAEVALLA